MNANYIEQSRLVVAALSLVSQEHQFALKGGTAINLFENDLPRLSVDIDLVYLPVTDRQVAIREINAALSRMCAALIKSGISAQLSGGESSRKILCSKGSTRIKIEPNFILRGVIFPIRDMDISPKAENLLGYCHANVLSRAELYGGKFCAALDRQHPRDLFDVAQFFRKGGTVHEVKEGLIALLLGHNRPLHEILAPNLLNHSETFASQFAGMSDIPFSLEEHQITLKQLVTEITETLTQTDCERLVAFTALEADADVFEIPGLTQLPAIQWKRKNLEALRAHDPRKFSANIRALEAVFA